MTKYVQHTNLYDITDSMPKEWLQVFLDGIPKFIKDTKILDNNFDFIAPIDFLKHRLPKKAENMTYDVPGTDLITWLYLGDGFRVKIIGTDRVHNAICSYIEIYESSDD